MDQPLWKPSSSRVEKSLMNKFSKQVQSKYGLSLANYQNLHAWSVENPKEFWSELFPFFDLSYEGDLTPACKDLSFKEYGWFPNVRLNFAENLLKHKDSDKVALNFVHESGKKSEVSYKELNSKVASLAHYLKGFLGEGDVLAGYMPNIPETVISMLGATSFGGVFTSTSSDFGIEGVVDRFEQSNPKVLVAACGYEYNGKYFDLMDRLVELEKRLPGLEKIIVVDFLNRSPDLSRLSKGVHWEETLKESSELIFKRVPFAAPLYIMYSSGTTGKPKCIVHSVGGALLQHVKELGLHTDLTPEKNIFYFTTCGWMMWNWLVSSLSMGATLTLYEGSPGFPSLEGFFNIIDREKINIFGTSPKFLRALEDSGVELNSSYPSLETILSTGAPLLPEQFDFIYQKVKEDVLVGSICGGTDIIGCFMLGNPIGPVYRGEIQCLGLGMDVGCFDEKGNGLIDQEGELVCKKSFPSRPIYFLDDLNYEKIKKAYFNKFENVWHHGDFITLTDRGTVRVFGRSDATLNPGGVRIGTAEIYRQTELLPYLIDSLCVGKQVEGDVEVVLFVKLNEGEELSEERIKEIRTQIRNNTTPRHMPKYVYPIKDIPYTRSGKKMELAITRILNGKALTNVEAVANPECLEEFQQYC